MKMCVKVYVCVRARVRARARDRGGEVAARFGQAEAEDAVDAVEVGAAGGEPCQTHAHTHARTHARTHTQSRPVFTHTIKAGTGLDRVMPSTPLGLERERRTEAKKGSEGGGRDSAVGRVEEGIRNAAEKGGEGVWGRAIQPPGAAAKLRVPQSRQASGTGPQSRPASGTGPT